MNPPIPDHPNEPVSSDRPPPAERELDWIPSIAAGLLGLAGFFAAAVELQHARTGSGWAALSLAAATALPMAVYERIKIQFGSARRSSPRPSDSKPDGGRVAAKILGLLTTAALLVTAYWLLPFYRAKPFAPFREVGAVLLPVWIIAAVPYFFWLDGKMDAPKDGYWQLGQAVLLKWNEIDRKVLRQHFLAWGVKGFFLPLMFSGLSVCVLKMRWTGGWPLPLESLYGYGMNVLFTVDLAFAVAGYALTLRALDSHVRSAEPTLLGWVSALICYEPFWDGIGNNFVSYEIPSKGGYPPWLTWLHSSPSVAAVWGSAILLVIAIFTSATVCFGVRFSNLTHRGIIGFGPYYFTKHPAYISKLISFALISIPFVPFGGVAEAVRRCLMFGFLIVIYRFRAVTEERHLSADPTYGVYAAQIEERHRRWFGPLRALLGFQKHA